MNKQPEALRLAEHLELHELHVLKRQAGALCHAAAELRRLHEENERLRDAVAAEREACAKVCEEKQTYSMPIPCPDGIEGCCVAHVVPARREKTGSECAAAIRARGET